MADGLDERLRRLMTGAQAGDAEAYAELLAIIVPLLMRWAGGVMPQGQERSDVMQSVLLTLHRVRHTYDPRRPFLPWLAAIARHRFSDARRKSARLLRREAPLPLDSEIAADAAGDGGDIPGDPDLLRRAIAELPSAQRDAMEMLKLREMSLKEASLATGMSVNALKVAAHRAMKALKTRLVTTGVDE